MRKIWGKFIAILVCVCILAFQLPHVYAEGDWIEIASVEEFLDFAENCRLDSFSQGKSFRLVADIDLSNTGFDGIPIFGGAFDGNYHKISGLRIESAGSAKGLFRYLQPNATVKNLTVEGVVSPLGSRGDVGSIAGSNAGIIENCTFLGQVAGAENVGGIAGINLESGVIRNCAVYGSVSGKHFVGGTVGSNYGLIESCTNRADVNATAQQNDTDISDITMDTLLNSESMLTATDIGGIAGYSEGQIYRCKNWGTVGYPHMGYNVGGIAGMQSGYIADCENFGAVFGRKEVGGILGQQEPFVRLLYSVDTVQILNEQVSILSDLIHKASENVENNATQIKNLINKLRNHINVAEKAITKLEEIAQNPQFEDLEAVLDALKTIQNSLDGIGKTVDSLWNAVDKTGNDLTQDMDAISQQLTEIENTLNHAGDNIGGGIFDISDEDTPEELDSKVENCRNYGNILADLNAGGIVGAVTFENDLDPEADISVEGEITLNSVANVRSVILGCRNDGSVNAKSMRVGGIAGWMTVGLVRDCINTGLLENPAADFVGGIVGESYGYIRSCLVKSAVSGDMYVGGIAGTGSIATDCQSMVIIAGTERCGAIFGLANEHPTKVADPIHGNLYLLTETDVGAIDGISYSGLAYGLSLPEFLLLQPADSIFQTVTITFVADGTVVHTAEIPTGGAFRDIPDVPLRDGATGRWEGIEQRNLECVLFDMTIEAAYTSHQTVIQSDLTAQDGKPILLLQGDFAVGASVALSGLDAIPALQGDLRFVEGWEFVTTNCLAQQTGRLLLPGDVDPGYLTIMVRDASGTWYQRECRVDGSYIVFPLSDGEDAVAVLEKPEEGLSVQKVILLVGIGVLAVGIVVIACVMIFRRKRRHSKTTTESET